MDLGRPYRIIIVTRLVSYYYTPPKLSRHATVCGVILLSTESAPLLEDDDEAPLFTRVSIGCQLKSK